MTEASLTVVCSERDALVGAVADRARLDDAERQSSLLAAERQQIEGHLSEIPSSHRLLAESAQALLDAALEAAESADEAQRDAEYELRTSTEDAEKGAEIQAALRIARTRKDDFHLLAGLLSARGLQGRLIEDAQVGIAFAANQELEAISRGVLRLEMQRILPNEGQEAGLALLVYDHASASEPFDAACLSGSQQFRVAVAIALGIGQYISGPTRGRRAVIIDEGFGSLDVDGVAAMSDHLRALTGRLDRVILVTHHAEMQRQFPHGFLIEKRDRTSRVREWGDHLPVAPATPITG